MSDIALRTKINIIYRGKNISTDIADDLKSFSYTDNESGTPDDIDITLKNDHGRWNDDWMPTLGDKIIASIVQEGRGAKPPLACGTFTLDQFDVSGGNGSVVSIKGVSVPSDKSIRRTTKSRGWEKAKLSEIAADIASTGSLKLTYATQIDPIYDRKDQTNISDLQFLKKLCDEEALNVKITNDQIVIFDPQEMDAKPSVKTIVIGEDEVKSWRFTTQNHDTYSESTVEYNNPKTGKKETYTEKSKTIKDGKPLKTVTRASSPAEAQRKAKAKLYAANKKEITGSIVIMGSPELNAGDVVTVIGAGKFDGKYKVNKASHSLSSGYETTLELNHTNNPVKETKETKAATTKAKKAKTPKKAKAAPVKGPAAPKKVLTEDEKWIMSQK